MTTSHARPATLALALLGATTACPGEGPGASASATSDPFASTTDPSSGEPTTATPTSGGTSDAPGTTSTGGTGTGDEGSATGDPDTSTTSNATTSDGTASSGTTSDGSTASGSTGEPTDCGAELGVLQGSYEIESELDIAALLPYGEVTGDLTIVAPGLVSLDGLQCLTRVGGDLEIGQTALTSLTGLDGLQEVGGQLVITGNSQLADLHALANLTTIGAEVMFGYLTIKSNPALTDLTGLGGLSFVGWSVGITANGLESLAGLGAAHIVGEVRVEYNDMLVDVLDLAAFIPQSLAIGHNHKLACSNAEQALALMEAEGFAGGAVFYDNLGGCGI